MSVSGSDGVTAIEFDAVYFDGKTSARSRVRVRASERGLHMLGGEASAPVALAGVRVDPPVGGTPRILHLPGGAQLQTDDGAAIARLFPGAGQVEGWVHGWEGRWGYALVALAVIAGFAWWAVAYGLPFAAKRAAQLVPLDAEVTLGDQTLAALDSGPCGASALDAGRQRELRKSFEVLTAGLNDGYRYRMELRACRGIGPNAFAMPGGAILVTDELVAAAQNDAQISAVLAHEIGHVRHRHGTRLALQAVGLSALIAALAGDAVSITSLAVALPTALLQNGYSREFEYEADTYAFQRLKEIGLSPRDFAEMLTRLEEHRATEAKAKGGDKRARSNEEPPSYLSTHPATAERIKRALANQ